ncbi:hypothetical protein Hanom_Chr03g00234031 [Helianthus anomalus]
MNQLKRRLRKIYGGFPTEKSFCISTAALDEFCEEYFSTMKDKRISQSNKNNVIDLFEVACPISSL